MKFIVDQNIFAKFPTLNVGIIHCTEVNNSASSDEIASMLREAEQLACSKLNGQNLKEHPAVSVWQDAHRAFGNNPNRDQPSLQALLKRVTAGKQLPCINPLVDCYNIISLRHLLPVGGEDLDSCRGDIRLCIAEGGEAFVELGGTTPDPALPGEVIYRDDEGVLCRKFNWREADRTKLTATTKNAVLVLEGLSATSSSLPQALEELSELIRKYTGAKTRVSLLNSGCCELALSE
jgi:DNA/RNA-binding domain of Phe-tRNA-synthetase-like protein